LTAGAWPGVASPQRSQVTSSPNILAMPVPRQNSQAALTAGAGEGKSHIGVPLCQGFPGAGQVALPRPRFRRLTAQPVCVYNAVDLPGCQRAIRQLYRVFEGAVVPVLECGMPVAERGSAMAKEEFAARLRELREGRGWTQAELAVKVGVSADSVAQWER